ncbi:aspartate/glutamate racemase family protein [Chloroflexota bacterium]
MLGEKRFKFLFIPAFRLAGSNDRFTGRTDLPKEERLMNYQGFRHLLEDVDWDLHEGAIATYGDWPVENREELCHASAARLPIVREACESGKYNAIILLGGAEPGFLESREIARKYNIPVTSFFFSQMHIASMLGNKFSVIDISEPQNMIYYHLVIQHRFADRCASIRNLNYPIPRPGYPGENTLRDTERQKAERGEPSEAVERAVSEAIAAIEEDGAEVIVFGCSGTFWLQPFLQKRLNEIGWEIPVLEGQSCSIILAKALVNLGVDASGLTFPNDRPKQWRRRKIF